MSLILKNDSQFAGKKGATDWWRWTAYIECTAPDTLDDILYVEYHLHPTFKNPVKRIHKRSGGFALKLSGWGVFELRARVVFEDHEKKPVILSHYLEFEEAVPPPHDIPP